MFGRLTEAPVERVDEMTYFSPPAVVQQAALKDFKPCEKVWLTMMIELPDCPKPMHIYISSQGFQEQQEVEEVQILN